MRLLIRVAERASFSAAAADLHLPRSTATTAIRRLEEALGKRLLQRTTRHVVPTREGEAYVKRCKAILADLEDAEAEIADTAIRGSVRIAMNGPIARYFVLPALPALLSQHPELIVQINESDRYVDVVREGYDCVIRAGEVADSELIKRSLGQAPEVTLASADYIRKHGMPNSIADLDRHIMVGFASSRTSQVLPLEFIVKKRLFEKTLPFRVCVNSAESYAASARLGFGLIQAPRYRYVEEIATGTLIEVLPDYPPSPHSLMILYPAGRPLPPSVRVFIDWLSETLSPRLRGLAPS